MPPPAAELPGPGRLGCGVGPWAARLGLRLGAGPRGRARARAPVPHWVLHRGDGTSLTYQPTVSRLCYIGTQSWFTVMVAWIMHILYAHGSQHVSSIAHTAVPHGPSPGLLLAASLPALSARARDHSESPILTQEQQVTQPRLRSNPSASLLPKLSTSLPKLSA